MRRKALGKHGWSVVSGVLLCFCAGGAALAAPNAPELAIGNPLPNALVGGRITFSIAYNTGPSRISAFTVYVDDHIQYSRSFAMMSSNGIHYLDLDTRTLQDGNHTVKIVAVGARGSLASDAVDITVRNGVAGGPDLVPPLVQFRGLRDGQEVSGKIMLDLLAEDNVTTDLFVTLFANKSPILLKNRAPYGIELDTAPYLDPKTGTGKLFLEAWAYDKAENLGKARPITLTVVRPGKADNQTGKQPDPLTAQPGAVEPRRKTVEPAEGTLVVPLGPKESAPMPQSARVDAGEGQPATAPSAVAPGARPSGKQITRNVAPSADPGLAPVEGTGRGSLSGESKATAPQSRPRTARKAAAEVTIGPARKSVGPAGKSPKAASVAPAAGTPSEGGPKASVPGARPATQQMASAAVKPRDPEIAPMKNMPDPEQVLSVPSLEPIVEQPAPRLVAPGKRAVKTASAKLPVASAPIKPRNDMPAPVAAPVPSVAPDPSPAPPRTVRPSTVRAIQPGVRAIQPGVRAIQPGTAPAPGAKPESMLVVVVPKGAKPDATGKIHVDAFRVNAGLYQPVKPSLKDRSYRVSKGETLESIAKRYKVSKRCLMVANGVGGGHRLRAGSILKVPGTFDVALNGEQVAFDVSPRVENGLPLAPFRQIFEHAGGVVAWYPESREVRAAKDNCEIKLKIGSKEASVNQMVVLMEREAFLENGRTIVPISFMEKAMDLKAEYDVKNGTISLVRQ